MADKLVYAQALATRDADRLIWALDPVNEPVTVYNFTVEPDHTYFVGKNHLWVHNANKDCGDRPTAGADEASGEGVTNTGSKALRPVGSILQSVDDVMANPQLLKGLNPAQLMSRIHKSDNWVVGTMKKTRSTDKGFTLRELNKKGTDFTDRYIQYHPGSRRHFDGQPYWKVSSGSGGTVRFPVNGG